MLSRSVALLRPWKIFMKFYMRTRPRNHCKSHPWRKIKDFSLFSPCTDNIICLKFVVGGRVVCDDVLFGLHHNYYRSSA